MSAGHEGRRTRRRRGRTWEIDRTKGGTDRADVAAEIWPHPSLLIVRMR